MLSTCSIAPRFICAGYRAGVQLALAAVILIGGARVAGAQTTSAPALADAQTAPAHQTRWEFVVPSGTMVPTAAQRNDIKRGNLTAVQVSYVVRPDFAITSTFGWARSRDIAAIGSPKLDVFTYDLGAEVRAPRWHAGRPITVSPFIGGGVGARSYNHRDLPNDATHNVGAYLSAGGELGFRGIRLRLEVRDYVTGFKPLDGGGTARARNDVVVMTGIRFTGR